MAQHQQTSPHSTASEWTVQDVISLLDKPKIDHLNRPVFTGTREDFEHGGLMFAVSSMRQHMTDEGWQIALALQAAGYWLAGRNTPINSIDIREVIETYSPGIVVLQDKREWDVRPGDFRDPAAQFRNVEYLASRSDIFKLTILKDAQQNPTYHRQSAQEINCHAWIIYYHPDIVRQVAPYVRDTDLVRTYHTIDGSIVPPYSASGRSGALLSGAISGAYPLRKYLVEHYKELPGVRYLPHPGYHRRGCMTPLFIKLLTGYKVAICTASRYGYALRKIIEATAAGCIVLTDLPVDEVMPEIDENLVRIHPETKVKEIVAILHSLYGSYDSAKQEYLAERAKKYYNYRASGFRIAWDIQRLRDNYYERGVRLCSHRGVD